jgi:hypothetical protein
MRIHENEHVRIKEQVKPDIENVRRLHLPVVKLTTVQATKLQLYHKIRKIGMICFAKPVLTEHFYIVQKQKFSIACMYVGTLHKAKHIRKRKPHTLVQEDVTQGL